MGKLAHCLPVVARPRLPGSTGTILEALALVQVAVNNVARSVVGHRREDHISIADLLEAAKYLLLNQQVVRAIVMSAWSAYVVLILATCYSTLATFYSILLSVDSDYLTELK
jgi:hypothetical protein